MRHEPVNLSAQLEIEEQMFSNNKDSFFSAIHKAQAEKRESETVYGLQLIRGGISKVAEGLAAWKEKADTGKAGRRYSP